MEQQRILILDTSAFIAGFDPFSVKNEQYSVPMVERELTNHSLPWVRFKAAVASRKLKLETPTIHDLENVNTIAQKIGDALFLSEVDLQILALALHQKTLGCTLSIVTDDFSIQNVAYRIGVSYTPLSTYGIRSYLNWILYCPACQRKFSSNYNQRTCMVCGAKIKRKILKK